MNGKNSGDFDPLDVAELLLERVLYNIQACVFFFGGALRTFFGFHSILSHFHRLFVFLFLGFCKLSSDCLLFFVQFPGFAFVFAKF